MANPASVYCEQQGGDLDIRTSGDGGQYGVCMFDDGSECDEWSFYEKKCKPGDYFPATGGGGNVGLANPASVYCEDQGGKLDIRTMENGSQYGVCMFDDGSECDEWEFYKAECSPGDYFPASGSQDNLQLANPAAGYCIDQGGTYEIRTQADGGQYGMCMFADGSECDEWQFYDGKCEQGDIFP